MGQGQTTNPMLDMRGVSCVRGDRLLFKNLDLSLKAGEAALLIGPNGSGKSSLLRLIAGLLKPYSGTINFEGTIGLVGDTAALDPRLPVRAALLYWAQIDRQGPAVVDAALDAMKITHLAQVPVRMLSTGQAKRAALARIIASGATIWMLDEPGNGLDTATLERLAILLSEHRARGGIIIAATHQPLGMDSPVIVDLGGL